MTKSALDKLFDYLTKSEFDLKGNIIVGASTSQIMKFVEKHFKPIENTATVKVLKVLSPKKAIVNFGKKVKK